MDVKNKDLTNLDNRDSIISRACSKRLKIHSYEDIRTLALSKVKELPGWQRALVGAWRGSKPGSLERNLVLDEIRKFERKCWQLDPKVKEPLKDAIKRGSSL